MKKLHVYALKPYDSYGGEFRVKNLAFYTSNDEKLAVTDITNVNDNEATFKVNGINGRIYIPKPYGYTYYPSNVFNTDSSEYYTMMVQDTIVQQQRIKVFISTSIKMSDSIILLSLTMITTQKIL